MGEHSKIEWTTHTFNPWVGCTKVSLACDHCYAETWAKRSGLVTWGPSRPRRRTSETYWSTPLKWNREAVATGTRPRVFCASLADVFDNEVPDGWRADLWALIRSTPWLDWILVTKRIGNAPRMLPLDWGPRGYPNVWLLITVCNQAEACRDIPKLLAVPARVRGLSVEPLLGAIGLTPLLATEGRGLDWVIVGGESGAHARPMRPDWVRALRDECAALETAFFFKQWGEWAPLFEAEPYPRTARLIDVDGTRLCRAGRKVAGRLLDGREWNQIPEPRR